MTTLLSEATESVSQIGGSDNSEVQSFFDSFTFSEDFFKTVLNGFLSFLPSLIAAVVILVVGMLISKLI